MTKKAKDDMATSLINEMFGLQYTVSFDFMSTERHGLT